MQQKMANGYVHLSQVCESIEELSSAKKATEDGANGSKATRKNTLVSAALVQAHNAIGTGLLLFPYTFWAFDGPIGGIAVQLVRQSTLLHYLASYL